MARTACKSRGLLVIVLAVVVVLVVYVLSDPLALSLVRRTKSGFAWKCYQVGYAPLNWVARQSPVLDGALTSYDQWLRDMNKLLEEERAKVRKVPQEGS